MDSAKGPPLVRVQLSVLAIADTIRSWGKPARKCAPVHIPPHFLQSLLSEYCCRAYPLNVLLSTNQLFLVYLDKSTIFASKTIIYSLFLGHHQV